MTGMITALGRMNQIEATLSQLFEPPAPRILAEPASAGTSDVFARALAASAIGGTTGAAAASAVFGATGIDNPAGATGPAVVAAAKQYLGVPYVFGGTTSSGMDCSGLVQTVFADLGVEVPRLVSGQMTVGQGVPSMAEAQPGDLIVLDGGDHIVIYAGDNKIIHAPYEGRDVSLQDVYFDESDITTIRRIVPATAPVIPAASAVDLAQAARAALLRGAAS